MSVLKTYGDVKSDSNFGNMLEGQSAGCELRCKVLDTIQDLVRSSGLLVLNNCLSVLPAKYVLRVLLMFILFLLVVTSMRAEARFRVAGIRRLEESGQAADADNKANGVPRAPVSKYVAERKLLTAGTQQAKAESNALADQIYELKAD